MTDLVEVARFRTVADAEQRALVLAAAAIASRVSPTDDGVALLVSVAEAGRAATELASYERENRPARARAGAAAAGARAVEAALAYVAVLLFFFAAQSKGAFAVDWLARGAAQAGLIADGAWWRTVTALTLHSGSAHLLGNIAAGVVIGLLAARGLGTGVAWAAIVGAGALGNGLNAALQASAHTSIGASTAVFGALGLLSGYTQRSRAGLWRGRVRRWAPVAAGVMLLAFFGMGGERTDIWAHLAGFAVGAGIGFALAHVDAEALLRAPVQRVAGAGACAVLALAWALALWR